MARAQGARAQMALAFETIYGTAPVGGYLCHDHSWWCEHHRADAGRYRSCHGSDVRLCREYGKGRGV